MIALMVFTALLVYLGIAWVVIKRLPSKKAKWIAVAIFILIPTWDEILGRIYFKSLCETESGVKIYNVVESPGEYWLPDGKPKFIKSNGDPDEAMLSDQIGFSNEFQEKYSAYFRIKRHARVASERSTGQVLGEYVRFIYFGGWLKNHTSAHVSGIGCPPPEGNSYGVMVKQILKQPTAIK